MPQACSPTAGRRSPTVRSSSAEGWLWELGASPSRPPLPVLAGATRGRREQARCLAAMCSTTGPGGTAWRQLAPGPSSMTGQGNVKRRRWLPWLGSYAADLKSAPEPFRRSSGRMRAGRRASAAPPGLPCGKRSRDAALFRFITSLTLLTFTGARLPQLGLGSGWGAASETHRRLSLGWERSGINRSAPSGRQQERSTPASGRVSSNREESAPNR